ncbi:RNA-binding protein [Candidatus Epulonipiscium fishelsonii]|uniref:RNA-binding protein n=1 Tax=Candidatus Epulonipiscium fishelsonii TaxID=77094 RepID=A0ACC8X969_9FIRM|nr:RNA-binding protein [Epulopiscium sp. SCG-B05WGA-EpuloA1]ONI38809.1 RNA-binding protein [Epulopiscium sp. SCG-B11WGA-EpuloA1]ONI47453.1 RNA-binding protein [Epulopiscium sp. SCG-C06WGA-EpuloA1]
MRIDKYLKVSRIIKRRTIAQEACDKGRVSINDKIVKAGAQVKVGDKIEINFSGTPMKYEVLDVKEHVKKEDTEALYRILE